MRLFVAIELDEVVRAALGTSQAELGRRCPGVRWIPPYQLHITTKFLGEVPDSQVDDVSTAVACAAAESRAFDMVIRGCGCFPPRGPVRIVWAGIDEPSGALLQCVGAVERQLGELGFPPERRPFSPHITIGRVREDRSGGRIRTAAEQLPLDPCDQSVRSLTLMSSVLSPKGPTYTPVSTSNLG